MKRAGYRYTLIGKGEKWRGWITRQLAYIKYLNSEPDDDTLYILVDVFDLMANSGEVSSPKIYLEKFRRVRGSIVLGAEPNCNTLSGICRPLSEYWEHNNKVSPNLYYNGGHISGYRKPLIDLIQYMINDFRQYPDGWNEQVATSVYIDRNPTTVHLDCTANFIGNIICHPITGNIETYVERNDAVYNAQHNTYPAFIHTPSANIDAMRPYSHYTKIVLKEDWERPPDGLNLPGYHWVIIGLIILTILFLLFVLLSRSIFRENIRRGIMALFLIYLFIVTILIAIVYQRTMNVKFGRY